MLERIAKIFGAGAAGPIDSQPKSVFSITPQADLTATQLPKCPDDRKSERCFPKGSVADTRIGTRILNATQQSLFNDSEILNVLLRPEEFNLYYADPRGNNFHPIKGGELQENRHMLQQIGWRGCVQTCVEMIKLDHGLTPNVPALKDATFRPSKEAVNDFARAGLQSTLQEVRLNKMSVSEEHKPLAALAVLESALKTSGPLILSLSTEVGEHALILDTLDLKNSSACVRDPFHGWAIEISLDALKARFKLGFDYIAVNKAA